METYVLLARSITYGQRMQQLLQCNGIRAKVYRAPRDISETGCGYGVELHPEGLYCALALLQQGGLSPSRVYRKSLNQYYEVSI